MRTAAIIAFVCLAVAARSEDRWKTIDEGFLITVPWSWHKGNGRAIDSNAATYRGKTGEMDFDEVYGLGYTIDECRARIEKLKQKEANPKIRETGEEIWHVDGRIADFSCGAVDPKVFGVRPFKRVAQLHVPYEGEAAFLYVAIFYDAESDLATARQILRSITWKRK